MDYSDAWTKAAIALAAQLATSKTVGDVFWDVNVGITQALVRFTDGTRLHIRRV